MKRRPKYKWRLSRHTGHRSGQREEAYCGGAQLRTGHATNPNGQHGGQANFPQLGCRSSSSLPNRKGYQVSTQKATSVEPGHRNQLGKGHIGIKGNELTDQCATIHSHGGQIAGDSGTATEGGIRQVTKASRAECRAAPSYGQGKCIGWKRRALATYTWMRMGKGPQAQWLHRVGKIESPDCPRGMSIQTGEHIVWECPTHNAERRRNRIALITKGNWKGLADPIWVPNDDIEGREETEEEQVHGVERFFNYLSHQFKFSLDVFDVFRRFRRFRWGVLDVFDVFRCWFYVNNSRRGGTIN